ncbi:antitoxin VapB [Gammaproteobacteria bacterium]
MPIAHVVKAGDSQAIRLPKEFHLTPGKIEIFRRGDEIVLREQEVSSVEIFDILVSFPEDFMVGGRVDMLPQERESL